MSLSNPGADGPKNPAVKFFEWNGNIGKVRYFDKTKTDEQNPKGKNVEMPMPFVFIVLDQLTTLTGFYKQENTGFWSNEVRNLKNEPLELRTKNGVKLKALYSEMDTWKNKGANYTKSVYIAFKDEDGVLKIGNLKLAGSAIGPWIEYTKEHNLNEEPGVKITGSIPKKNGNTDYFEPIYAFNSVKPETIEEAKELDRKLQVYLDGYLKGQQSLPMASSSNESGSIGNPTVEDVKENPVAKSLADLVTAKQLGMIRALAREKGVDADDECRSVLGCATDELSKKAASAFIGHLNEGEMKSTKVDNDPTIGAPPVDDDDIPF